MTKRSVSRRPSKPASTPVTNGIRTSLFTDGRPPVNVWVEGSFNGPELVRRLAAGGLELRTSGDGTAVALVKSEQVNDQPPLVAFYDHVPGLGDAVIHTWEALSALEATAHVLSNTIDQNDEQMNEGLANAVWLLTKLVRRCEHGEPAKIVPPAS